MKRLNGDRTAEALASAIGLSLSDLKKDPRRLAGQLMGRLMAVAGFGNNEKGLKNKRVLWSTRMTQHRQHNQRTQPVFVVTLQLFFHLWILG